MAMFVAWTAVAVRADAERLGTDAVSRGHALCVQIEGPVLSLYRWDGHLERTEEFRLMFKCLPSRLTELETCILSQHPYSVPEWIVVRAEHVGEKYLSWAGVNSTTPPL